MSQNRNAQRGQVAVMFALVFALLLGGLIGLVGDVVLLYDAAERFDNGALVGAQAGASQVDETQLRQGRVVLDAARAAEVCREAASITAEVGSDAVSCQVSGDGLSISARVTRSVPLVFASFGPSTTIARGHTGTVAIGESRGAAP